MLLRMGKRIFIYVFWLLLFCMMSGQVIGQNKSVESHSHTCKTVLALKNNIERILADKNSIKAAIEAKGVTVGDITLDGYADKIASISSGSSVDDKFRVRFIDYDGAILQETYINSGESVTSPNLPTHADLTFQGWNHDSSILSNITSNLDVGVNYVTADGKTHFYICLLATPFLHDVGAGNRAE